MRVCAHGECMRVWGLGVPYSTMVRYSAGMLSVRVAWLSKAV